MRRRFWFHDETVSKALWLVRPHPNIDLGWWELAGRPSDAVPWTWKLPWALTGAEQATPWLHGGGS